MILGLARHFNQSIPALSAMPLAELDLWHAEAMAALHDERKAR